MMNRRRTAWVPAGLLLAMALVFACASFVHREDRIAFSHKMHVKEQELSCDECHADLKQSERIAASTFPMEKKCLDCHEKTEGKCGKCHSNPRKPKTWQHDRVESVTFSHKSHLERTAGKCDPCHKDMPESTTSSQDRKPRMFEACMSCHRKDFRAIACKRCHADLVENPVRPTRLFSHDADFTKRHGELAKGDERVCSHCHRDSFCADCHSRTEVLAPSIRMSERVDRDLVHRGDFITRHAIEARSDPNQCLKCHSLRQCESCHEHRQVAYGSKDPRFSHPKGWMNPGSDSFHGEKARRDIVACAACHDQGAASNCVRCHKVGGAGGRPHPAGWSPIASRDNKMCRACHGK